MESRAAMGPGESQSISVGQLSATGTIVSGGYTADGLFHPQGIAVDGAGSIWVANVRSSAGAANPSLTQLSGSATSSPGRALSPPGGWLADAGMLVPYSLAIDASGNVRISTSWNNAVTEVIGLAPPVRTPLNGPPQAP